MKSVKGQGIWGHRAGWQMAGDGLVGQAAATHDNRQETMEDTVHETMEDWADESPESEQLRRALIESGRAAMPRHDPARLERVFRRIMAQLEEEQRDGVPAPRLDSPSGVTAKMFG
jgi:chorismate mutase